MEFRIGAEYGQTQFNTRMAAVWESFVKSVDSLPFDYSSWKAWAYYRGVGGIAGADLIIEGHPEYRAQSFMRIVVDPARFFALDENQAFLTLLHESMHLHSFSGAMRATLEAKHTLGRQYDVDVPTGGQLPLDGFERARLAVAFMLPEQLFEFDAENLLKNSYGDYTARRAVYFAQMRRSALAEERWLRAPERLRPFLLLVEWLRIDLGFLLAEVASDTARELTTMIGRISTELAAFPDATEQVERLKSQLRYSALGEGFEAIAPQRYTDVFNEILSIRPADGAS